MSAAEGLIGVLAGILAMVNSKFLGFELSVYTSTFVSET